MEKGRGRVDRPGEGGPVGSEWTKRWATCSRCEGRAVGPSVTVRPVGGSDLKKVLPQGNNVCRNNSYVSQTMQQVKKGSMVHLEPGVKS